MPLTQVTLVNGTGGTADGHVHVNIGSPEEWVDLNGVAPGSVQSKPGKSQRATSVEGRDRTPAGNNTTRVQFQGAAPDLELAATIHAPQRSEIVDVRVMVSDAGGPASGSVVATVMDETGGVTMITGGLVPI